MCLGETMIIGTVWSNNLGVATWFKPLSKTLRNCPNISWPMKKSPGSMVRKWLYLTTVGQDCILGVSVALGVDTPHLTEAYQHFKDEAQALQPEYAPETVNTDGWGATQKAWFS